MNSSDWGLTALGFKRPTYTELLDALEYKARELFGQNAVLTVRSPLGLFLRIYAWMLGQLFQLLEDVYNSRFIDTAVGASLYNVGKAIGLRLLPAQKASGYLLVTGRPGTRVPSGFLAANMAGVQYVVVADATIAEDGTVLCAIQAFAAGPESNTGPNTITTIINPKDGITAITNPAAVDGGRNRETDEQFRDRYYASVDYAGGVNADALRAELLQSVESIHAVTVLENDTDTTDADGLPPHSVEIICYGGLDGDIAKAIHRRKAAGIQTHGNTSVPVITASGQTLDIRFSRPMPVPIWVLVELVALDDAYLTVGPEYIKQTFTNYIGGDVTGGLSIGEDVVFNRLHSIMANVPGVIDYRLFICADSHSWAQNNIAIGPREKAVTDAAKVVVEA